MRDEIINLINKYGPLSYSSITNFLKCEDNDLAIVMNKMEDVDVIKKGKLYHLIDNETLVRGTVVIRNNHPYLKTQDESIFIDSKNIGKAFDKDIVIAEIILDRLGRKEAIVYKVVEHYNQTLVCKCTKRVYRSDRLFKVMDPNSNYEFISVPTNMLKGAHFGDICVLDINYRKDGISGSVKKIIGHDSDIGSDVLALIEASKVPYIFPDGVYDELDSVPDEVSKEDLIGRVDFTRDLVITIDGDDSKDFDDAVNVVKLSNGNYRLSVHIADVSHYVKEGSEIDREALNRGTSIYLVDRVVPMLPEKLSNGICSLNEGVVRLVLSCVMDIDKTGKVVDSSIVSGYIKSKRRMTYSNVNKILELEDEKLINKYSDIYDMLLDMKELSKILRQKREARGSLDFDVKEMKICVDDNGMPINVLARERGLAEMLIEDFMLEANETVAQTLYHLQYPCCYRVHEEPNKEKLNNVNNILKNLGVKIPNIDKGVKPLQLQSVMNKIKDTPSEDAINTMLLRAMAKARYDARSLGHYGLAAEFYCHFTSPIRRYPDLQTHRMINNLIIKPENFEGSLLHYQGVVDFICERSSECERKAIDLERMVDDMKAAEYMENKVGNIYSGIITSVTSFGFFVMLDNTIEGLVHIKNLPDFYTYDEKKATLSGNYSKEVYNIGDAVKVRLIGASKEKRQIDFMIVSHTKKRGL